MFNYPGVQIQLYLVALAFAIALLGSFVLQRVAKRHWAEGKYAWVTNSLLPALLLPFLTVVLLGLGEWISILVVPFKSRTITGFLQIAMVWFATRALLLIAQRHFMAYFISSVMLALALLSVTNLLAPTQASLNGISFETSTFRLSLLGAIKGTFSLIVLFWGAGVLSQSGEKWIRRLRLNYNARELAIKFLRITLYFVAFVLTLNEMNVDLTALTVFGGAFGVGLGFGLQKITSNFVSGIILLFENSIESGDLIEVGGEKGWVREMAIRHTMIETSDGREMLIPNEDLIVGKVTNWTYTNTRARIDILISAAFDSDVDTVLKLLLEAAQGHSNCLKTPAPAAYMKEFTDHGIQFLLVFWIPDVKDGMSPTRSDVMLSIVRAMRSNNIAFAKA